MYYFQNTAKMYLTVLPLFWTFCTANSLIQWHMGHKSVIFWRWKPGGFNTKVTFKFGLTNAMCRDTVPGNPVSLRPVFVLSSDLHLEFKAVKWTSETKTLRLLHSLNFLYSKLKVRVPVEMLVPGFSL